MKQKGKRLYVRAYDQNKNKRLKDGNNNCENIQK